MKTQKQIVAAMTEWLCTQGLTVSERALVSNLRNEARKSITGFQQVASALYHTMPSVFTGAITKARAQGRCQEWTNA